MNLLQNIHYLISKTNDHWTLGDKQFNVLLFRIVKNMYSEVSNGISKECQKLFDSSSTNRRHIHVLLEYAYEIENSWRDVNQNDVFMRTLVNPFSFDRVEFTELAKMSRHFDSVLYNKLITMNYEKEYKNTPYFKAVERAVLDQHNHKCDVCDDTRDIKVHAVDPIEMGKDHRKVKNGFRTLCPAHFNGYQIEVV